jgi:hypothetical protein
MKFVNPYYKHCKGSDRLCGLVRVLATDPEARIRFPALPDFWEVVGLERGPLSLVNTIEELLERKNSASGLEIRKYGLGICYDDHVAPSLRRQDKTDKMPPLGEYSSFADWGHGVFFLRSLHNDRRGFTSRRRKIVSSAQLGPTQPAIQWVPGTVAWS